MLVRYVTKLKGTIMLSKYFLFLFLLSNIIVCSNQKKENQFEINLPNGWMKISKETVEFLVSEKIFPSKMPAYGNYDYLYQLKSNDTLFSFPYIIIQINDNKRLAESELKSYGSKYFKYDATTNYLWKYSDSTIEVIIPTEKGTINVFCYSSKNNYPIIKNDFKHIVNSIFIYPDIKYSSNFFYNIPVLGDIIYSFIGTKIFFLIIIILLLVTRKFKNKKGVT